MPFPGLNTHRLFRGVRWHAGSLETREEAIAEETPIALIYNDEPHVVMMGSPTDLDDFAVGFSVTEGIVSTAAEIVSIEPFSHPEGIAIKMRLAPGAGEQLAGRRRNLTGRTGCGLCGAETLAQALRAPKSVGPHPEIDAEALQVALERVHQAQPLNSMTGAVHAALWCSREGGVETVREDVGRHNALDKLIGARLRSGAGFQEGFLLLTSRASYELIYKASQVGIGTLAAMSAPTGLAIRMAQEAGMTLIGFLRDRRYTVYTASTETESVT